MGDNGHLIFPKNKKGELKIKYNKIIYPLWFSQGAPLIFGIVGFFYVKK